MSADDLHPDLEPFNCSGGLFDVGNTSLLEDVSARVRYVDPQWPAERGTFKIIAIQKNYRGDLCYRVVSDDPEVDPHRFGQVATVDAVEMI